MNKRFALKASRTSNTSPDGEPIAALHPRFDAASALDTGKRDYQQDAVIIDFTAGEDFGIAVLADGMGGHMGGEVASALAVSEAYAEMKRQTAQIRLDDSLIVPALRKAIERANTAVADHVANAPQLRGMGTTLVICLMVGPDLYWASVGDSPLYLYRDGNLKKLNSDHSMAPGIDAMVASGLLEPDMAANHPQRNQLLSAVCGTEINQIDCRGEAFALKADDILLLASDGVQTLTDQQLCEHINQMRNVSPGEIAQALVHSVRNEDVKDQDNISTAVMKINHVMEMPQIEMDKPNKTANSDNADEPPMQKTNKIEDADDLLNQALLM